MISPCPYTECDRSCRQCLAEEERRQRTVYIKVTAGRSDDSISLTIPTAASNTAKRNRGKAKLEERIKAMKRNALEKTNE